MPETSLEIETQFIQDVPARSTPFALAGYLCQRREALSIALDRMAADPHVLSEAAHALLGTLRRGGKVLAVGNGGSAAEAQHFAGELVGRFKRERAPFAVLALTNDSAIMTAVANDYGFDQVFARQVGGLGKPGDLLLAFSTSGESANVVAAAGAAKSCGMKVVAVTADHQSRLQTLSDVTIRVPVAETALAQELHLIVIHALCDVVEAELSDGAPFECEMSR